LNRDRGSRAGSICGAACTDVSTGLCMLIVLGDACAMAGAIFP
jgi:hypothetical protein